MAPGMSGRGGAALLCLSALFAHDGSLILVSASRGKTLRVWDLKDDGNVMKILRGHQNWVYSCVFSPDSSMLCSVGASKAVFLWNMEKYTMIRKLEGHHHDVVACDFSPDGALLATASYDTRVYIWNPHTGDILMELGMVRFWRIGEDHPVQVAPLSNGLCCAISTNGSVLAAGTHDGSVYFGASPQPSTFMSHVNPESDVHSRSPGAANSFQSFGVSLLSYLED
ncbi:WD repeat and SOCS box-containing protein 1 [Manis javanica]|nr:WD repeat and SOCS box-containing protein 1 [Manis javanica]